MTEPAPSRRPQPPAARLARLLRDGAPGEAGSLLADLHPSVQALTPEPDHGTI